MRWGNHSLDESRRRILEDLTGVLQGELRVDALSLAMYATDASLYQITPLAVAFPRHREDVITLARYAHEKSIPLIARGAGSGITGQVLGPGIIVDFSRFMKAVESIGPETVRVQPGVVRDKLNEALRPHGRYFPPDPSNSSVTTVGGMLGVDAAGSHSVRIGSIRDHVDSLEVVLAGGVCLEAGNEPLTPGNLYSDSAKARAGLVSRLAPILGENTFLIREWQPPLPRNSAGYFLRGVLSESHLALPRLLVGSEGTLALFTAATLHHAPLPEFRGAVLVLFGQLEAATRTVQAIAGQQPSACDLLDRRLLSLAREADPRFEAIISPAAEAALIIEQTGFGAAQVRDRIYGILQAVREVNLRAVVAREAYTHDDVEFLWSLPSKVVPLLARLRGQSRPLPFVEDIAVPPEALHDFLVQAQRIFQKHEVTASLYSHAASGQVHLRPFLPPPGPQDGERIETLARDLYQAVFAVGGTISGEHGDGLSRSAFLREQYGPLYPVFQQIKQVFDPHNILNPGKILTTNEHLTVGNFRPVPAPAPQLVDLKLQWKPDEFVQSAARCNGCGSCRTQAPDLRMCPFFRIDTTEEASPRAKANVVRHYATGLLDPRDLTSASMKRLAELCFNCKQCQIECPSNVDIPHQMIEARAAYVAAHGLSRPDWILSRAHSFGTLGGAASLATNWAISNPLGRWLIEKFLGIARQRKISKVARRPFMRTTTKEMRTRPPASARNRTVVYYVGDYANFYDPELAHAFVAIMRHNGWKVHVPPGLWGSAMAMISAGDLEPAREVAQRNVRELAELAREGFPIICTEPSAVLALREEYPMLIDHPDVKTVASRVVEAGAFLEDLHSAGKLRTDFQPLDVDAGYHLPCHLRALGRESPLVRLLKLIPQMEVHRIEEGCSGMAGAWGLTKENFRTSIRLGWGLITRMRSGDFSIGITECSSCRIQMEQGTTKPTIHPLKLMALAYGLMPEISHRLTAQSGKLVLS